MTNKKFAFGKRVTTKTYATGTITFNSKIAVQEIKEAISQEVIDALIKYFKGEKNEKRDI